MQKLKAICMKQRSMFVFSWHDFFVMLFYLGISALLCSFLKTISETDFHVPLIFGTAVLFISLNTTGYFYGLLSSFIAVFFVNIVFTYPYFKMNFSLTGYPITFICMLLTSILSSTVATRAREVERIRISAEREAMRANLLRAVSHDFRTPLTSIIGSINVIQENSDTLTEEETDRMLTDTKHEAQWLINMVENLLSVTRINENNQLQLHLEPQLPEEILFEAVTKFRRQYPDYSVTIEVPEDPFLVEMDATLIEQVVINVLLNSATHGETADASRISVTREEQSAVITIQDNGIGFSKENLLHINTGKPTSVSAEEDSTRNIGIGLTVCNSIIKAHGGTLRASNNQGAEISFSLPVKTEFNELWRENVE